MYKKITILLLVFCLSLSVFTKAAGDGEITVFIDGEQVLFDVPPQTINDRTMVPMRAIFEALGATVDWNEEEQSITSAHGEITIYMAIDNPVITVNGEEITLDAAPVKINDRTLVPVRAVAESFEAEVLWDEEVQRVDIKTVSEPSASPEPSGSPDPTASPDPSASPEPSASVSPTASPSASPSGSPSASASPSATPTAGWYEAYPEVPDFGRFTQAELVDTQKTPDGMEYYYDDEQIKSTEKTAYERALRDAGFTRLMLADKEKREYTKGKLTVILRYISQDNQYKVLVREEPDFYYELPRNCEVPDFGTQFQVARSEVITGSYYYSYRYREGNLSDTQTKKYAELLEKYDFEEVELKDIETDDATYQGMYERKVRRRYKKGYIVVDFGPLKGYLYSVTVYDQSPEEDTQK